MKVRAPQRVATPLWPLRHASACTGFYCLLVQSAELYGRASPDAGPGVRSRTVFGAIGVLTGIALLAVALRKADLRGSLQTMQHLGWAAAYALVPSVLSVLLEAHAWRLALAKVRSHVGFLGLLRVRVATEWITSTLPLGALWADGLKPVLLARTCDVPVASGITALLARKYLLVASQAAYSLAGALCAVPLLSARLGSSWASISALALIVLSISIVGELMRAVLGRGSFGVTMADALSRLPWRRVRAAGSSLRTAGRDVSEHTALFFRLRRRELAVPLTLCLCGWLLEATETWILLDLVGLRTSFPRALGAEVLVVLLRHVLAFLPAGLGAQELGYAALLAGGPSGAAAIASFAMLKRLRELCWVAVGVAVLTRSAPVTPAHRLHGAA